MKIFFFGLNRVYISHHLVGAIGFILLVLHPLFLLLSYLLISLEAAIGLIIPSLSSPAVTLGSVALLLLTILLIFTFYFNLEYDTWKKTHQYLGIPLFFAILHSYLIGSTLADNLPLRIYIFSLFVLGLYAYVYRLAVKNTKASKYPYIVSSVEVKGAVVFVELDPVVKPLKYFPGQFIFIQVNNIGVSHESHPFSLISSPEESKLAIAVKSVGDYTETLKLLKQGSSATVEGPYGKFTYSLLRNKKQVWIGAGIGITPFVSMAKSLPEDSGYSITLYYCVKDDKEAVFAEALKQEVGKRKNITLLLWKSADSGRLSVENIAEKNADLKSREIFVCGPPPMMESLKNQFKSFGVRPGRIHSEEFSLS